MYWYQCLAQFLKYAEDGYCLSTLRAVFHVALDRNVKGIEGQNEDLDANIIGRPGFGTRTLLFYTFGFLVIFEQNKNIWRLENTGNLLKQPMGCCSHSIRL